MFEKYGHSNSMFVECVKSLNKLFSVAQKKWSSEADDPLIILWLGLFFYVLSYFSPNRLKLIQNVVDIIVSFYYSHY